MYILQIGLKMLRRKLFIIEFYHSKKYQNFPIVLGWKFMENGQFLVGNLRETEISISPLGDYGK